MHLSIHPSIHPSIYLSIITILPNSLFIDENRIGIRGSLLLVVSSILAWDMTALEAYG